MFSGEEEKLFYDHGEGTSDRKKEKSVEEPISPERATRDIGGDEEASPHQLQESNLKTYARREKGKSSCVIPSCQLQSPISVLDSPADSSGNDSSSIEPSLINSVDLLLLFGKVLDHVLNILSPNLSRMIVCLLRIMPLSRLFLLFPFHRIGRIQL
ncbi:hypothetical protein Acr_00g0062590 [Actinidia rufa]|uniref:Uncharacterized protein n=1 Tax=Actinidia rufa TaxID=165716 RepID=A0A7J0DP09_9ERIC|nr:hypothetical protein Acr_00g0062590 [Actinidia rufa]